MQKSTLFSVDSDPKFSSVNKIPSMGGRGIGGYLYQAGLNHSGKGDVVEVGSWLGSSCAYVALGLSEIKSNARIHCFDRFTYKGEKQELVKALDLKMDQDLTPIFRANVLPVYPHIRACRTDIMDIGWKEGPIEIYIDDASKKPEQFLHVLKVFGPSFIPGCTVLILMDFNMYLKKDTYTTEQLARYRCQKDILDKLQDYFRPLESFWPAKSMASFLYEKEYDFRELDTWNLMLKE